MLCGLALNHYYTNHKNVTQTISFEQMYNATHNYFKGPKHKHILNCWNKTTLWTIITKHPKKSTLKCLQLLINDLRHL